MQAARKDGKEGWDEIMQLARILDAEAEGRPVDRDDARRLAEHLAATCPGIRNTMLRVRDRMAAA